MRCDNVKKIKDAFSALRSPLQCETRMISASARLAANMFRSCQAAFTVKNCRRHTMWYLCERIFVSVLKAIVRSERVDKSGAVNH